MSLNNQLKSDLKEAMRAKDELRLSVLRMLSASITNKSIELLKKDEGLSDEEILDVVKSEVKKRKDAVEEYKKGGRQDLSAKEEKEMNILISYLPPELSNEEIRRAIEEGVRETGASGPQDFGKVMKVIMPALKGKVSGDRVATLLKERLNQ